jgi:hypothetical protein
MTKIKTLCLQRRALSDRLPRYTLRHDDRVAQIQALDAEIITLCQQHGITEADAYRSAIGGNAPSSL